MQQSYEQKNEDLARSANITSRIICDKIMDMIDLSKQFGYAVAARRGVDLSALVIRSVRDVRLYLKEINQ